jgi:hypothetical protein
MVSPGPLRACLVTACLTVFAGAAFAQSMPVAEDDAADLPPMPVMAPASPPAGVRKLSDAALSCDQIYAEASALEASVATHRAASEAAQREATQAQEAMMKSASGSMAVPVASSLLGMIPGGNMISGMAAQAAMQSQMSAMQDSTAQMTAAYQRMAQAQEALAHAQARNDHLVGLFLNKGCKLPEGQAAPKPPAS